MPGQRPDLPVVAAVAAGGALGALARHGLTTAWPSLWATLLVNVTGCLLIGAVATAVPHRRLLRPFLGVGVLGGYTTFSAFTVDALRAGSPAVAFGYLAATVAGALLAVWAGAALAGRPAR
ncbi:fluoride efflux transporter FluC [Spirilliplanes yamanashiensis]|uniref:Fluoride-specific ion channel FluC n=1 Tax=Spirilliplanes yamanashiensis TaxID=42233 RepID=A0A8J4DJ88_9ACTN|nr:CrcB family protein [Spirilliplanes yamanashiensis]MDP9815673.1 CrcB protein [Spirilliplanes yamanashiensis]GIJ03927.1 hypothetical protein Sya03_32790 [Spirilliplanes yamanashiensis]